MAEQEVVALPTETELANSFLADVKAFWRYVRIGLIGGAVFLAVVLVAEIANIGRLFYAIHPALGWAFAIAALGAVAGTTGVAVYRYITTPRAILPPEIPADPAAITINHIAAQAAFIDRYLQNALRNPELASRTAEISALRTSTAELIGKLREPGSTPIAEWSDRVRTLTDEAVPKLLSEIDAKVDALILREALAVGLGTAISPNGLLDAFIVLWRNLNLVSRLGHLYYGRPGLAGTLVIGRDVAGSILIAGYLESVADAASSLIAAQLGSLAGAVAGPAIEGMTNALVTVRIGHLAKARCRSFRRWDDSTRKSALAAVGAYAKEVSGKLWKEIIGASGSTLAKVGSTAKEGIVSTGAAIGSGVGSAGRAIAGGFGRLFGKKKDEGEEAPPIDPGAPPPA